MKKVSEQNFEASIEATLLAHGPDSVALEGLVSEPIPEYGEYSPGRFAKRHYKEYDRELCLDPDLVVRFIQATQPKEWKALTEHYGDDTKVRFLQRLSSEIGKRGTLDVLRKGVKDSGTRFELYYPRPASGLNPEIQKLYEANMFTIIRQLRYIPKKDDSIDVVLFLNGLPIFTAELKNPFNGQTVQHAIHQYRDDRDPRQPLLVFGRCLGHFAVDPDFVYVTTKLEGEKTDFLPFNRGKHGGAGNEPDAFGFSTRYLWERTWSRDSILELIQRFIHTVEEEDDKGRETGRRHLIFPRYHQLDTVRRLVTDAKQNGTEQKYLIEHSAGSGKSNTIAWLAHQLSVLHDAADRRVFDSIVVITDRRVLDRQLQRTVRQFEQTLGVVENIDKTSRQLKEALEGGKTIIVTTLQKFPVIADEMKALDTKSFAVIIDEAHSSQTGESTASMKRVLAAASLEEAEKEDAPGEDLEDRLVREAKARGPLKNVSMFAFTATPKAKTIELFGTKGKDGMPEAFSLYTMRQAIEEGFIMDVLANYTTYRTYWKLLKKIEEDPKYDKDKASYLLRSFVELHPHAINEKVAIMAEHFASQTAHRIGGRAKAMIVTRSRLHAVKTKLALDKYLEDNGYPYRALVAFSGTVKDGGADYTEVGMNGFPERQTAATFKQADCRFLVVAEKFQTGFDEPMLHTMYVDKKLSGVNAVQTLSRLNRVHPDKTETAVLDFANEASEIEKAFQPYYEKTVLSEETNPNLLYDLQRRLEDFDLFTDEDLDAFAQAYFDPKGGQDAMYAKLAPTVKRYEELTQEDRADFKHQLGSYVRLYAFLAQVAHFVDAELERLYVFARLLLARLPKEGTSLPVEIQEFIDIHSFRVRQTSTGALALERGTGEIRGPTGGSELISTPEDLEPLSQIIRELNDRFGTDLSEEDIVFIEELENRLSVDPALEASVRVNTPENARLTFHHVVEDRLQEMVETNFDLYKRITDDEQFGKFLLDHLFDRYRERMAEEPPAPPEKRAADALAAKAAEIIATEVMPQKVILFGSAATGELRDESDLDFLIVMSDLEGRRRETKVRLWRALSPLRMPVDLLLFTPEEVTEWENVIGHVINEAFTEGVVMYEAA